jgi:phage terminase large subunit GpA-like protein
MQRLLWEQLRWLRELPDGRRVPAIEKAHRGRGRHLTETAVYVCQYCGAEITHDHKQRMLAAGEWRATAPETGVEGFHINELYSPMVSWQEMAAAWVLAKKLPETLKQFVNERLGLSWEEDADKHDPESVRSRAEDYLQAPKAVLLVTAAADVQDDRVEVEAVGWGRDFESWSLEWRQFLGDPAFPDVWAELDEWLKKTFTRVDGRELPIDVTMIDSGHHTDMVYRFCRKRYRRRVYALKGVGGLGSGHPIIGRIKRDNKFRCPVLPANVDQCKDRLFGWLSIDKPGPGYMHFPVRYDQEYFYQLTAEDRVERVLKGQKVRAYVQTRARNEALDLRVYNLVAVEIRAPKWETLAQRFAVAAKPAAADEPKVLPPPKRRAVQRNNWVTNW